MKSRMNLFTASGFPLLFASRMEALQHLNPFTRKFELASVNPLLKSTSLFVKNEREVWEKELLDTKDAMDRLNALETAIKEENIDLIPLCKKLDKMEDEVSQLSLAPLSPLGLSMRDYKRSVLNFAELPISLKLGLYIALGMDTSESPYPKAADYAEIVSQLHEQRLSLTIEKIENSVDEAQRRLKIRGASKSIPGELPVPDLDEETQAMLSDILGGESIDKVQNDNVIKQLLGRVTRKENTTATAKDLNVLLSALEDKSIFVVRGSPEEIPGGYVVRGVSRKESIKELLNAIDSKLPTDWDSQVSYMPDLTRSGFEERQETSLADPMPPPDPVLLLLKKDFSTENDIIRQISNVIAVATTLYFGINAFEGNTDLVTKITENTSSGNFAAFDQLNSYIFQILAPIAFTQLLHQLGHIFIADRDKFQISAPTLIPFAGKLPNLGLRTEIKSSPPSLTSLFDFAFIGPFVGVITSLLFLIYGLVATTTATPDALQNFPSLSVADIRCSTLGGTIVDYFLGGGNGAVTSQDLSSFVKLHPFALAGFVSLLIQALELIPFGSTDGGRMSLALFGRSGNVLVGGTAWFALFVGTLFLGDASKDLLLNFWVLCNFAQNDMEIPSRDEISNVDAVRSLAGFALWFVAILTVVPF